MNNNPYNIKLVAVDMDGTFARSDYTYDVERFNRILNRMENNGCQFVVASGNQYYQLRSHFPDYHNEISFVAENGALVKDKEELIFSANISRKAVNEVLALFRNNSDIQNVMCGVKSAYCEKDKVNEDFFNHTKIYYHKLNWVDDFAEVDDQILKFAPTVPVEKTEYYCELFDKKLNGLLTPTSSGRGSIDLIIPGNHKASGLKRLVERWEITSEQCVAFGDGGNDIEMLKYCGRSYAMENASEEVKKVANFICPSNDNDGVLEILEELFPAD